MESYCDYAMFYTKKMFGTCADNIYFDDPFLIGSFDIIGSAA